MNKLLPFVAMSAALTSTPAAAADWIIGDDDGYGAGIPNNGLHSFSPVYDGRSSTETAATNGAQFTDTYSTTHPGFSPQDGTVATFVFSALGSGWGSGTLTFDIADLQPASFGATIVSYNGFSQSWNFQDPFPATAIHTFALDADVLNSINSLGSLTVTIDRNNSGDFYGFDFAELNLVAAAVPEPSTWMMMLLGFGAVGFAMRRRSAVKATATC